MSFHEIILLELKQSYCYQSLQKDCNSEAGFTLMELIIVCVLVSLVLTISIPTLRNSLYTNELNSTARKIVGTVKELRNLAVRKQKSYLLHFDIDANRIWYELDDEEKDTLEEKPETGIEFPDGVTLKDVQSHSQGKKGLGSLTIWVSKRGYMDQTVVHLSDEDDKDLTLFFSPFSGSAKVYDEYVEIE